MTTPTQAAIEAARERLAKAAEADCARLGRIPLLAKHYRDGGYDGSYETQALAIALQEMSDAAKSLTAAYSVNTVVGSHLAPFILPDPVVDPVEQAVIDICKSNSLRSTKGFEAGLIRNALRRGMELAKGGDA